MKTIKVLFVAIPLAISAAVGVTGCMGDRYHDSTGEYIDDATLTTKVKSALGDDEYKYPDVKVTTFKGTVQLSGFVADHGQKARAGSIARGVKGVHGVDNNISIKD